MYDICFITGGKISIDIKGADRKINIVEDAHATNECSLPM